MYKLHYVVTSRGSRDSAIELLRRSVPCRLHYVAELFGRVMEEINGEPELGEAGGQGEIMGVYVDDILRRRSAFVVATYVDDVLKKRSVQPVDRQYADDHASSTA